jgi:hypothetical protein
MPACHRRWIVLLLAVVGGACLSAVAEAEPPALRIPRVQSPPRLQDFLGGTPPPGFASVTDFKQREPGDGVPASRATTVYLAYDDRNFYAVFVCKEDPSAVRANLTRREAIMGDDVVGLILDSFRDRRHAYLFLTNPLGIQMDGITTEGQDDDYSFDTLWHSEGRLTGDGYVVWMSIPFKSLRFSDASVQTWGIALGRIIPTHNETSFWPYITRRVAGFGQQLATLEGIERISPGRNLQFIPYGAASGARYLDEQGGQYATNREGRAGLDAKMVVRDALTVDMTANPDFSQVESDEPQVTINQRFEVFFPEKRPFFIENANMFATPENLFFSRRVADPQFGARLTGKVGRWAVAGLVMDDRARGNPLSIDDPLRNHRAFIGVTRVQREMGQKSTVGFIATGLDFGRQSNGVLGVDTRLQLSSNWILSGQAIATKTTESDGKRLSGPGFNWNLGYNSRAFSWEASYIDLAPDFRADLGYVPRTDIRKGESGGRYRWFPKGKRLLSFGPSGGFSMIWDHRNQLQDWEGGAEFDVEFPSDTRFEVGFDRVYERYEGLDFHRSAFRAYGATSWLKWLSLEGFFRTGTAINYYPADGMTPFLADTTQTWLGLTLRPSSRLRLDETYIFNRLQARPGAPLPAAATGADIFNLHLARSKANYQFTRALSLRAIVDYNAVLPDSTLVALTNDKRITADVLLTYLLNPGTALYVGYTDRYANLRLDPADPPGLLPTGPPTTSVGRQIFVKMSYLLRY